VRRLVSVNDAVVVLAQDDEVTIAVPFGWGLPSIVSGPIRFRGFDVANIPNKGVVLEQFRRKHLDEGPGGGRSEKSYRPSAAA